MARIGHDTATTAARLGWRDKAALLRTYMHASNDLTVTDDLFDTKLAQGAARPALPDSKKWKKP